MLVKWCSTFVLVKYGEYGEICLVYSFCFGKMMEE